MEIVFDVLNPEVSVDASENQTGGRAEIWAKLGFPY